MQTSKKKYVMFNNQLTLCLSFRKAYFNKSNLKNLK
jgi:hypothetical protein